MNRFRIFDTSVLIPWFRHGSYNRLVRAALASKHFLLCTVVWMELYAGTRSQQDKRDLDRLVHDLSPIDRIVSPDAEDFYRAGQMLSFYRRQSGGIRIRDHANDILIALCASKTGAELVTVNREDMERWRRVLSRSRRTLNLMVLEDASD
jgi:predicted nucleic acid-binding protein